MSDELIEGRSYYVRVLEENQWSTAERFNGEWCMLRNGITYYPHHHVEVGPRVLYREELLANSEEITRLRAENADYRDRLSFSINRTVEFKRKLAASQQQVRELREALAGLKNAMIEFALLQNKGRLEALREMSNAKDRLDRHQLEGVYSCLGLARAALLTTPTSEAAGELAATSFTHAMPKCEVCGRPGIGCCTVEAKPCSACSGRGHGRLGISGIPGIATCEACNGTGKEPAAPSVTTEGGK